MIKSTDTYIYYKLTELNLILVCHFIKIYNVLSIYTQRLKIKINLKIRIHDTLNLERVYFDDRVTISFQISRYLNVWFDIDVHSYVKEERRLKTESD